MSRHNRNVPLSLADFNGDGYTDVAVGNGFTVTIMLNNGKGIFPHLAEFAVAKPRLQWPSATSTGMARRTWRWPMPIPTGYRSCLGTEMEPSRTP